MKITEFDDTAEKKKKIKKEKKTIKPMKIPKLNMKSIACGILFVICYAAVFLTSFILSSMVF